MATARASGRPVVPVYVFDEDRAIRPLGAASKWWLEKSLIALAADLAKLGSRLILRRGKAAVEIAALVRETGAGAVAWNLLFDPGLPERDARLAASLSETGVEVLTFNGAYLVHPDAVRTKTGGPFRVFTPFWRAARAGLEVGDPAPKPRALPAPSHWPKGEAVGDWRLHPTHPDWSGGFIGTPGEAGGAEALDRFVEGALAKYATGRDRPGVEGSSHLSAHLHFGEIGPQAVWRAVTAAAAQGDTPDSQADVFVGELGWREFCAGLLFHQGDLALKNYDGRFDAFPWRRPGKAFAAWKRGMTGYPIVDAGMRQLWATGWMHNRVRMITASFLTKHLLIDWREGERWFWDTLTDADHASNAANWQWVAGSGADASPYFRIFNPIAQGAKFDPDGAYVRRWVPEIAALPDRYLHAPWTAPARVLETAGIVLGDGYPAPIVDHATARVRALEAYRTIRNAGEQESADGDSPWR